MTRLVVRTGCGVAGRLLRLAAWLLATACATQAAATPQASAPASFGFGNQTVGVASAPGNVIVQSVGTTPLQIFAMLISGTDAGDFYLSGTTGCNIVPPGSDCTMQIGFWPSAAGLRTAEILVFTDDAASPTVVALTGTGAVPTISVSTAALAFPNTGLGAMSDSQSVGVSNAGVVPLTLSGISLTGANPTDYSITSNTCPATLSPSQTCTVQVASFPLQPGARSASVAIASNDPVNPLKLVSLSGTALIAPAVASSQTHTLALDANGQVYAWGSDGYGQLGQGRAIRRESPLQITGLPPISHVAQWRHVLAVDTSGQVWSWGESCNGGLGPRSEPNTAKPGRVAGATGVIEVAAGQCVSIALKADGTVWGWGQTYGTAPTQIAGLSNIQRIAAGFDHVLALDSSGRVWALGNNSVGQLGTGNTNYSLVPVQVPGLANVVEIAAGMTQSMARTQNGDIYFWGGIFGNITPPLLSPTQITGLGGPAVSIAIGQTYLIAARNDGVTRFYDRSVPAWFTVAGFSGIKAIASNGNFTLGIDASNQVYGSGLNTSGQLGQGNTNDYTGLAPAVTGMGNTKLVAASQWTQAALAVKHDGTLWFWGGNPQGQSGDAGLVRTSVPQPVTIPATIKAISVAPDYSMALDTAGNVWAWGRNEYLQTGSAGIDRASPALIGVGGVRAIAAGDGFSLYLKTPSGAVTKKGFQLYPITENDPTAIPGLTGGIVAIAAGQNGYAIDASRDLWAFGVNQYGGVGNGTTTQTYPVKVNGLSAGVARVAAGAPFGNAVAITTDGKAWSWGTGGDSVGNGTAGSLVPVQVTGITDAVDVAVGDRTALVRRQGGGVVGWGRPKVYDTNNALTPFPITMSEPIQALAVSADVGFLVGATGLVWGFGYSFSEAFATVGDGTFAWQKKPVVVSAPNGGGTLDGNNWFLDLQPASAESVPAASTPKALAVANAYGANEAIGLSSTVKYRASEVTAARKVKNYVIGIVPPAFLNQVKSAPSVSSKEALERKAAKAGGMIVVQLTPAGWADVNGQLLAYSTGTANAAGGASNILNGVNLTQLSGARFCVGYGDSAESMLSSQSLREVLSYEGAAATVSGVPCVLSGVYVDGPPSSVQGSPVAFKASVVGAAPTGSVQFRDSGLALGAAVAIAPANEAVGVATYGTSSLAVGTHSIGASYSGDSQNPADSAEVPRLHVVMSPQAQTRVALEAPASSATGGEIVLVATVTGNQPTGTVQFKDGGSNLGAPVAIVEGVATLRIATLGAGSHSLTAAYSGDVLNAAGTSAAVAHLVSPVIATRVALASSANPAAYNTPLTVTATVSGASPTGNITLRDGATTLGSAALSSGAATFNLGTIASGLHALAADYSGDGGNAPATSPTLFQAVLEPSWYAVSVAKAGSGSGTVASSTPGVTIDCGAICSANVVQNTVVTLQATPAAGSLFAGWSGACAGTGNCVVTASQARSVTATFNATYALTVARTGAGAGSVSSSSPAGAIDCGVTCSATFVSGTSVTLVATPAQGSIFAGWGGACSGTGNCVVSMTQAQNVTAAFGVPGSFALTVTKAGSGTGTVTSTAPPSPSISCGSTCIATYTEGTVVTLAAAAGGNAVFAGWSGACTGTGTCVVTLDQARTVTATFNAVAGLGLSAASIDFGIQSMGATSLVRTVTATNTGSGTLTITGVSATSPFSAVHACAPLGAGQSCPISLTVTPAPANGPAGTSVSLAGTLTVTTAETGDATVSLAALAQKSLVAKYYGSILRREPDSGGQQFWNNEATRLQALGVNVNEVWFAMAQAFYFSAEYLALNRDNTGFVTDLYNTFFNRAPDQGGLDYWVGQLAGGMPREVALASFMFSAEFRSFTSAIFGNTTARAEVDAVVDFYRGLLARLPDDGGFAYWVGQFRAAQCSGQAAILAQVEAISSAYTLSAEYAARNRGNVQYVGDLYNAFLRRGGDLAGVLFWINQVATGAQTREQVRVQFRNSAEFQQRVKAIIAQGCLQ